MSLWDYIDDPRSEKQRIEDEILERITEEEILHEEERKRQLRILWEDEELMRQAQKQDDDLY